MKKRGHGDGRLYPSSMTPSIAVLSKSRPGDRLGRDFPNQVNILSPNTYSMVGRMVAHAHVSSCEWLSTRPTGEVHVYSGINADRRHPSAPISVSILHYHPQTQSITKQHTPLYRRSESLIRLESHRPQYPGLHHHLHSPLVLPLSHRPLSRNPLFSAVFDSRLSPPRLPFSSLLSPAGALYPI